MSLFTCTRALCTLVHRGAHGAMRKTLNKKRKSEVDAYLSAKSALEVLQDMVRVFFKCKKAPKSVTKCRKKLRGVFIHISDFVRGDLHRKCKDIRGLQARVDELGPYPLRNAKLSPDLRVLLRHLFESKNKAKTRPC